MRGLSLYVANARQFKQDLERIPAELLCKKTECNSFQGCYYQSIMYSCEGSLLRFTPKKGEKTRSQCIVSKFTYREISQQAIEPSAADSLRHHNLYSRLCFSRGHTDNLFLPQRNAVTLAAGTREMKNKREHCLQPCQTA